ncbi:ABC transporter ATP-binding protein [Stieleria sp. TO1_6]|uniref:ABC transporter ATP-binding protein n=1 Tax=Stieleria tagensis TaxID=2956795 RepID=UPI00209A94AD|nr:ABC transporter ATP-binding protein [Stieleria tagensis]MCO8121957.1 ABC transporter ATP-binding protein [Stieleria tagensis]
MSTIQLREISLRYDRVDVLRCINFVIAEGEYAVILGASGCGKTSLLRMIAGLIRPTAGQIFFDSRDVTSLPPRRRDVALVPQFDGLYPHFSLRRSIAFGLSTQLSALQRERRVIDAAERVGIQDLLERRPEQLSGGQLRRAAVAKAIARQAAIRLLDEPLSAVDATLRFSIEQDLRRLHQASPGVTLHVTHDGAEAMRMADRIAVIEQGQIAQFDTPERLRDAPATPAVAAALGQSPFHTVALRRSEAGWSDDQGQTLAGPEAALGSAATIGFYQSDVLPSIDAAQRSADDWLDTQLGIHVRSQDLRWFQSAPLDTHQ